ncbi:MAG: type IV pilus assembly protein PilM [Parcubacteria group bacterium]|nr:type IV pilus assembly protein PilM [Parcubacteria group bacterium]
MAPPFKLFGFELGPKNYLGVDIGTLSIKIIELSIENGRPKLQNYGILENYSLSATNSVQGPPTQKTQKIFGGEAVLMLRRLLKESGITAKEINMSMPIFSSFLTVMELPQMSEAEIKSAVQFEAKKYIPVSLDSVAIDWSLIGSNGSGKILILLVAIPRELINEYASVAGETNLKLLAVELETISAVRALMGNDPTPTVLVDMGSRDTTISIVDGGFLRISHSIETSGEDLTRVLSNNLNVSWRRAEEIKKENGLKTLDNNAQIAAVLIPLLDTVALAIKNIIEIYFTKTKKKIERLIIYGGAAKMPGLAEYFEGQLKIDVAAGDPFSRIAYPPNFKPIIDEIGHEFTVAAGLALRSLQ